MRDINELVVLHVTPCSGTPLHEAVQIIRSEYERFIGIDYLTRFRLELNVDRSTAVELYGHQAILDFDNLALIALELPATPGQ